MKLVDLLRRIVADSMDHIVHPVSLALDATMTSPCMYTHVEIHREVPQVHIEDVSIRVFILICKLLLLMLNLHLKLGNSGTRDSKIRVD